MAVEKKVGGYICTGCGIGDRLDTDQLETIANREGRIAYAKQHSFLCSEAGVKMIQDDLDAGEADHLVIAACSHRSKTEAFNFGAQIPMTRANLREGVIWIRPDTDEAKESTQEMADDYVRMACAEVKQMTAAEPSAEQELNKSILVVGGGITGMTAAIEAAKAGYPAAIVEKTGALGGAVAGFSKVVPDRSPYIEPVDSGIDAMLAEIEASSQITVYLNSTVAKTSGAPGRFSVDIATESGSISNAEFGAIVQATGFTPYDANQLVEMSYSQSPDIMTQIELEALVKAADGGELKRPSDGKVIESAVFVQCAGQRSKKENELDYCSGHCCNTSIKQAMYFQQYNGDVQTTILFTDLRTPGANGEDFYRSGQEKGITFRKGEVIGVADDLTVTFQDLILAEQDTLQPDLVVLATGMVANSGINIEAENIKSADESDVVAKIAVESILNLDYRQGSDVPQLVNGFTDSHFICFPYETRRTGIYTAGPVRRPMDAAQAKTDAMGATMKAIQAAENAGKGMSAHPRSGDLSFPTFRLEGCTQCKRCTVECPFGAIDENEKGYPQFNESRCRRCGTCMGACPVRVISFENYNIQTVSQQIKAVDVPDEFEEKPRILVMACENDAYPALDMAAATGKAEYSEFARIVPVRCLGSVSTLWIIDALSEGYDGIILMGCKKGADYQCHFVKGSEMAHSRMAKIGDTLEQMAMEQERVAVHEVAITDIERAPALINEMAAVIERIGLSPNKF